MLHVGCQLQEQAVVIEPGDVEALNEGVLSCRSRLCLI